VKEYESLHGEIRPDLLAACPPCQGMSSARSTRGFEDDADAGCRDPRNLLVLPIAKVATALEPRIVVVENVPAFLKRKVRHPDTAKSVSAARLLISLLEPNYKVFPLLVDLCDFGVPQTRRRAFLTFVHRSEPALAALTATQRVPYPLPTHAVDCGASPISLEDALLRMRLPSLDASTEDRAHDPRRKLHFVPVWKDRRYHMVAAIPPRSGASAWQNNVCPTCGPVDVNRERASCPHCEGPLLKPVVRSRNGGYRLIRGFVTSSYRRMNPSAPAATITTASGHIGSDLTIHPWENRVLSPLECADLQTIPRDFKWGNALHHAGVCVLRDMIGEAVPPLFTRLHGAILVRLLSGPNGPSMRGLLTAKDDRVTRATNALRQTRPKSQTRRS
jgi:DNA (cytosine-5)-methyltransferase 1